MKYMKKCLDNQGTVYYMEAERDMTDRDRLAEKIFMGCLNQDGFRGDKEKMGNWSEWSIKTANVFFDTLEANNNEDD